MLVILPAAAFLGFLLLLIGSRDPGQPDILNGREAILESLTLWYATLTLSTEILGWLHELTFWGIAAGWALALGVITGLGVHHGRFARGVEKIRAAWRRGRPTENNALEWGMVLVVSAFAVVLGITAFLSPPNTNDSLTYHMSRVMHWIQNQSVAHYPTSDLRQLWNPPGVEYAILHLQVLVGSDRLAPFVQWTSYLGCLAAVSLAAERLGAGARGRWLAIFFCLTIPMAIIQATSTQNDLTTALWAAVSLCWILAAVQRPLSRREWVLFGLAMGLGVFTKGTFYVYVIPFLGWVIIGMLRSVGLKKTAAAALAGGLIVILLNAGIWSRNLNRFHAPLGDPKAVEMLTNQEITPAGFLSIFTRNVAMEMMTPAAAVNQPILAAVEWIHTQIHQDMNDARTSLRNFSVRFSITSEDYGINPLHMGIIWLLWAASGALLIFRLFHKRVLPLISNEMLVYSGMIFLTLILFSTVYKWQPWGGRLLLPFFVAAAPLFGAFLEKIPAPQPGLVLSGALVLASLAPLLTNTARPFIKANGRYDSIFTTPRQDLLFINSPELKTATVELARWVRRTRCERLGLLIQPGENEYPLWALLAPSGKEVRIEHLDPDDPLGKQATGMGVGTENFQPCAVFVTYPDFETEKLPGFEIAESRDDLQLYVLKELIPLIR